MKIYITFGQDHVHQMNGETLDKDCVAVITCDSHEQGKDLAFQWFGNKFSVSIPHSRWGFENLKYFPRGLIEL